MALSEHPTPFGAWAAAARDLLELDEAARAPVLDLVRQLYAPLRRLGTVGLLVAAYQRRADDPQVRERAQTLLPKTDPTHALRLASDAAYYRRWRELLEGRP